jgi:hypothetical protein
VQNLASRQTLPIYLIGVAWIVWLVAVLFQSPLGLIGVAIANCAAAYALFYTSPRMPEGVITAFRAIAYGLVVLGVGELLLMGQVLSGSSLFGLMNLSFLLGALLIAGGGLAFPWAIEQIGIHPQGYALRNSLLALSGGALLSWVLSLLFPVEPIQLVFSVITFFLTLLFLMELLAIQRLGFKKVLQYLAWAFVLASLSRLITIFDTSGGFVAVVLYGSIWLFAMSVVVRVSR